MSALPDQLPRSRGSQTSPGNVGRFGKRPLNLREEPLLHDVLLRIGGGLGLSAVLLGIALLLVTCAGFDAALDFSPAVITLGMSAGILTAMSPKSAATSSRLSGFFLAILAVLGGVIEMAVWLQWSILFSQRG